MYPTLSKLGICTSYNNTLLGHTMNAVIAELECLGSHLDLIYKRSNNSTAKLFFIPNQLSSHKTFENWERKGKEKQSLLEFMSENKTNIVTNDPVAILFVIQLIIKLYPNTFNSVATKNGYWTNDRMNEIETATVLSYVVVGDEKL